MAKGLKISLPGNDVREAEPKDCSIYSPHSQVMFSDWSDDPVEYDPASDPGYGTHNILTVAHGLDYIPNIFAYVEKSDAPGKYTLCQYFFGVFGDDEQYILAYADDTNLYLDYYRATGVWPGHVVVGTASGGVSFKIKYFIVADEM